MGYFWHITGTFTHTRFRLLAPHSFIGHLTEILGSMKEGVGVSSCEMEGLVGGIVVQPSISRVAQGFLPVTPITDWMQMQMNVDNVPAQELAVQPVNLTNSTLFLDFGGSTVDGHQYVTSLLKCESPEEVVNWGVKNTGARDAAVQALYAMEAGSAGEYISKTAGSIGTVSYQLQRHEHEISVNQHMGIENKVAIGEIQEDIKTERGTLRAYQKFVVDLETDVKTVQEGLQSLKNKTDLSNVLGEKTEKVQGRSTMLQDNLEDLRDQNEMMKREIKVQKLVLQNVVKMVTGKDDDEIDQVRSLKSTRPQNVANHGSVDQSAALGCNEALSFTCRHNFLTFQNAQSMSDHPLKKHSYVWKINSAGEAGEMLRCIITRAYVVDLDLCRT